MMRTILLAVLIVGLSVSSGCCDERSQTVPETVYSHGVVAADHALASAAGVEILRQGGNVVDAAVAVGFALSVVRPASSGIGGGGFMLIYDARTQRARVLDYRETAPARATRDMYISLREPGAEDASRCGALAVAVPGHVAGLCRALKDYGTRDLPTVLAPALRLCRDGVPIDGHDIAVQTRVLDDFRRHPGFEQRFATLWRLYLNSGQPWKNGDVFRSPLAKVLQRVAEAGPDGFYKGPVADAIVAESSRGGGILTLDDLADVHPKTRDPLTCLYDGRTIYTMPPPSSGGVALIETLQTLTAFDARGAKPGFGRQPPESPQRLHVLAEAFKHAFADRAAYLGDPDFADVPVKRLTSLAYATELAARIATDRTQPPENYGRITLKDDGGTSHFSVIDAQGNAVACTETINTAYGSYVVEPAFGIILNNEMDDFTARPGRPNAFGLQQSEANTVAAGKRPLSSMMPTIVVRDGTAEFALGASGGPRIISATTQVLLNLVHAGISPQQAINAPRIHHQWQPDRLELERAYREMLPGELRRFGHDIRIVDENAAVQAVARGPDGLRAGSDPRKHGRPAGY